MRIFWIFTGICLKVMFEKKKYLNIKSADHGFLLNKIENEGNMAILFIQKGSCFRIFINFRFTILFYTLVFDFGTFNAQTTGYPLLPFNQGNDQIVDIGSCRACDDQTSSLC